MMDTLITHLRALRAHGAWADARLLAAVRAADHPDPDAVRELSHVRGAQEIWLARIEGRAATLPVWPTLTVDELERAGRSVDAALAELFERLDEASLERGVSYVNTAGQQFSTPVGGILLHLLTHGQYHRGKANVALRDAGAEPVGVDYIVWLREQAAGPVVGRGAT